jgi:peptidoglycan hydrolase-like protein with peptidoglycan-binding domain
MSATDAPTIETAPELGLARRRRWGRAIAGTMLAAGLAAAGFLVANPFDRGGGSGNGFANGSATSLATVERTSLTAQTQVDATLGYADASTIAVPGGTPAATIDQADQAAATARGQLETARATLAADRTALAQARATLAADRQRAAVECRGANAAEGAGDGSSDGSSGGGGTSPCSTAAQALATDEQTLDTNAAKVATDEQSVATARTALADAEESLAKARATAAVYGESSLFTYLPDVGQVIRRGQTLFEIDGQPVVLLYGPVTPWRAFVPGMSPGRDVAELNANLRALGYGPGLSGNAFTSETAAAIRRFQRAHGIPETGRLLLGAVAFEPGAVRVTSVTPTIGSVVQAGAVLAVTSTRREVTIDLDAAQQTDVAVGDPVTITLPDDRTTPGKVSYVGSVATAPTDSDQNGADESPTVEVRVVPTHPAETGRLDQAPVFVSITTATAERVLAVPVTALLALAGGGYAVEEVGRDGAHRLIPVELGLFDDSSGRVEVTGPGLTAGQRVVVPAT